MSSIHPNSDASGSSSIHIVADDHEALSQSSGSSASGDIFLESENKTNSRESEPRSFRGRLVRDKTGQRPASWGKLKSAPGYLAAGGAALMSVLATPFNAVKRTVTLNNPFSQDSIVGRETISNCWNRAQNYRNGVQKVIIHHELKPNNPEDIQAIKDFHGGSPTPLVTIARKTCDPTDQASIANLFRTIYQDKNTRYLIKQSHGHAYIPVTTAERPGVSGFLFVPGGATSGDWDNAQSIPLWNHEDGSPVESRDQLLRAIQTYCALYDDIKDELSKNDGDYFIELDVKNKLVVLYRRDEDPSGFRTGKVLDVKDDTWDEILEVIWNKKKNEEKPRNVEGEKVNFIGDDLGGDRGPGAGSAPMALSDFAGDVERHAAKQPPLNDVGALINGSRYEPRTLSSVSSFVSEVDGNLA